MISAIRRELRKLADGLKVDAVEVERIVKTEVLKREIIEGDDAESASKRVAKFYRKSATSRAKKTTTPKPSEANLNPKLEESVTDRLLREAEEEKGSQH